jgi:2-polyprenyl-3-methyl-5-hydroxy-6-metoxy-1,4-benzoquinol methylase
MRVGIRPSNPLEALAVALGVVPLPLVDTQVAFTIARAIMAGCDVGVFEALRKGPLPDVAVARCCSADERATKLLLDALVGSRYLAYDARTGHYALTKLARRWLLADAPQSLRDKLLFQKLEWDYLGQLEDYVRTGVPIELHQQSDPRAWEAYQRGMRSLGRLIAGELCARAPVPDGAREMLDIGGSTGLLSAALCRRHPNLRSTILDLPQAIEQAASLLSEEQMGDRVRHLPGNALECDLGEARYDFVLLANLAHHFSEQENRELSARVARSLAPGGVFVILDIARAAEPSASDQLGSAIGLYFGLTSRSGCWSIAEMSSWQHAAGLDVMPPIRFRTAPGTVQQPARRA